MGLIPADVVIPRREVEDRFIALSPEEADLYDRIDNYISKYYDAYKNQGATQALGFIMTVYRRRLTSSFAAMKSSMRRRLDALENRQRLASLLDSDDQFDVEDSLLDPEDLDTNTELLRQEIDELKIFVRDLESMTGADTKAEELMKDVGKALLDYDSVVIFTQYTDTMNYLRDRFTLGSYTKIGCYSGDGGQIYDHTTGDWKHVAKGKIKEAFRNGEINILLGTDSMSEGLNLQTCGRVFQVEMPWNFARSEQRNGRCDRIGARYQTIKVTNYFYAGTVEERVYSGIKKDYTDFTDIVGAAQPVLADIEKTIEQLSLQNPKDRDAAIDRAISRLKHEIDDLAARPIEITDVGSTILEQPPVLESDFKPGDLKNLLLSLMTPLITFEKVDDYQYSLNIAQAGREPVQAMVTWDRDFADSTKMEFLTFGSKSMNRIFALIPSV
jgi:SNF2 family DNA or RNA helicase